MAGRDSARSFAARPTKGPGGSFLLALVLVASFLVMAGSSQASASPPVAAKPATAGEPLGQDAVAVAREHLRVRAGEFGLSADDVRQLRVASVVPSEHNGLTHVYFQQRVDSIDVFNAILNVAVTSDREVLNVATSAVTSAPKRANTASPGISDVAAARSAAAALGLRPTEPFASSDEPRGADRKRELRDGGISADPIPARLVYQPTRKGGLRLAWDLVINQLDGEHWWQIRIDALTGDELDKNDWGAADSHQVYALPTEAPSFGGRTLVNDPADSTASPFGWQDTNGAAGPESTLTTGNNVYAYTDLNNDNLPDVDGSPDGGAGLVFDFPLDLSQPPSAYRPAAVTNLYFTSNRIHDILYRYGFTESAGNFQVNNYGRGGAGADPVHAQAQDGGGLNNANFFTPVDGQPPRMQMYVWNAPEPDRDGDLDNGIIVHEYGHGVSNRLTGGPSSVSCLANEEQGGEGWSDYLSYMMTMPNGVEPPGGRGIGTYALNQPSDGPGIREFRYSTDMAINPHTYDSIKTAAVPHGVGSVWAEMLWELTYALIDEHGFDPDLINGDAGNTMSLELVMDGLKLQSCSPGFVDARDAILAADVANYAGANECLIWTAFAKRGLGYSASQGNSGSMADGTQAFDLPPACNGVEVTAAAFPSPVPAGQQLTYDLHLENMASGAVSGGTVTSQVGDHASYVAGSATCGGTYDAGTKTVTFPIGAMAAGATQDCQFKALIDASPFTTTTFEDDFEPDLSNWVATHGAGSVDWTLTTTNSNSPSHAAFAVGQTAVSDQYLTLAEPVTIEAGDSLYFWHAPRMESAYDGGVVEVSTDGGSSWVDIGAGAFTSNGYNATISSCCSNPISNRPAFTGGSSYLRSVASLAAYEGQSILLRFRAATDNLIADVGWTVDDIHIGKEIETTNQLTAETVGYSAYSFELSTRIGEPLPLSEPGAPSVTDSTPSQRAVSVAFSPPGSDGNTPITSYTAECVSTDGGVSGSKVGAASPLSVAGLSAGKSYHCRVLATNAVGDGPFSGFGSTVLVPAEVAGAPSVTGSVPSAGAVSVAFAAPASDGGSPVTGYTAECVSTDGGVGGATTGVASPLSVPGLSAGKSYHCRVLATNAVGNGPYSGFGSTVQVPAVRPGKPVVTKSKAVSKKKAKIKYTLAYDGGSPVTSYRVTCISPNGGKKRSATDAASPTKVKKLTPGKKYRCKVRAKNAVGVGPWSKKGKKFRMPGGSTTAQRFYVLRW